MGELSRYHYDLSECRLEDGWRRYDNSEGAWFGVWIHPERREIVTYAEGDQTRVMCPTPEAFRAELEHMAQFYGPAPSLTIVINADGTITRHA